MCNNGDCGVHYRVDVESRDDQEEFIGKITYLGDWAVYTEDNQFLPFLVLLGKPYLPHMSLLIKVGTGTIGDLLENNGEGMKEAVYEAYFTPDIEKALDSHDMLVYGLQSDLLRPTAPIRPLDAVMRY